MLAWEALADDLCSGCGRPRAVHAGQTADDYHAGHRVCPSVQALDRAQAEQSIDDDRAALQWRDLAEQTGHDVPEARMRPERARTWLTWTDAEGEPPD